MLASFLLPCPIPSPCLSSSHPAATTVVLTQRASTAPFPSVRRYCGCPRPLSASAFFILTNQSVTTPSPSPSITRLARPYCLTPGSPAPPTPPLQVQLQIQHLLSSYKKGGQGEVGTGGLAVLDMAWQCWSKLCLTEGGRHRSVRQAPR